MHIIRPLDLQMKILNESPLSQNIERNYISIHISRLFVQYVHAILRRIAALERRIMPDKKQDSSIIIFEKPTFAGSVVLNKVQRLFGFPLIGRFAGKEWIVVFFHRRKPWEPRCLCSASLLQGSHLANYLVNKPCRYYRDNESLGVRAESDPP